MPITIRRFVQTEQCGWTKDAHFEWNGRRNKELIGWSSSLKAVGYIKKFHAMTQLDDMDFIAVRIQHERRDPNSQLQCLAGLCNSPTPQLFSRWFDKKSSAERIPTQALGEFDNFFDHNSKKCFYFSAIMVAGNKVLARSINPPSWATNNHKNHFFPWYEMPDTSKSMSCLAPCAAASITWNISSAVSRVRFRSRIGRPTFPP